MGQSKEMSRKASMVHVLRAIAALASLAALFLSSKDVFAATCSAPSSPPLYQCLGGLCVNLCPAANPCGWQSGSFPLHSVATWEGCSIATYYACVNYYGPITPQGYQRNVDLRFITQQNQVYDASLEP